MLHNRWKRRDRNNIYSNNWIRLDQGVEGGRRVLYLVEEDSQGERGEHADQHGCLDAICLEHGNEKDSEDSELRGVRVQVTQRKCGGGAGDDEFA